MFLPKAPYVLRLDDMQAVATEFRLIKGLPNTPTILRVHPEPKPREIDVRNLIQLPCSTDMKGYEAAEIALVGFLQDGRERTKRDLLLWWDTIEEDLVKI